MKTIVRKLVRTLRRMRLLPPVRTTVLSDYITQFNEPRRYYADTL